MCNRLAHASRDHTDAIFVNLNFLRHADPHESSEAGMAVQKFPTTLGRAVRKLSTKATQTRLPQDVSELALAPFTEHVGRKMRS
jgi:hypothetical protein